MPSTPVESRFTRRLPGRHFAAAPRRDDNLDACRQEQPNGPLVNLLVPGQRTLRTIEYDHVSGITRYGVRIQHQFGSGDGNLNRAACRAGAPDAGTHPSIMPRSSFLPGESQENKS